MKNQLYRAIYHRNITLKDGLLRRSFVYDDCMKYGVMDEEKITIDKWEDLLMCLNYTADFIGLTDKKGRVYCRVEWRDDKNRERCGKLYKDDFEKAEIYYTYTNVSPNTRFKYLVDELSIEDFMLFLKDNEIKYLPNLK